MAQISLQVGRVYPRVRRPCSAESSGAFAVDLDPEILALDADLDSVAPRATTDRWRDISSDVRLGYQLTGEGYGERSGGSAVVGWSFEMPLDLGRQRSRMASAAESETRYLGLQRDLRRTELENRYRDLDAREGDIRQSQQFANARLQAAAQAVHERELRAARLAGDVTEQLLASRVGHYGAERARIDAYRSELLWFADWARFEPRACGDEERGPGLEAAPVPRSAPAPVLQSASQEIMNPGRAVYLWSSEPWLTGSASGVGAALSRLKAGGTGTVMVSLDADQIEQAAADGSRVRRLIGQAAAAGIRTELLLGDSAWILPRHRSRLLHIVQQLRELPFSGLHLDLEPNMLDDSAAGTARLLPELVETLRLARDLSPWPVGCSLHPRYLTAQVNGVALGDRLTQLGIATTLMIYVANPQRVVEIAQPILVRFPRLRFRIALSIEHTLSREESLFTFPEGERAARIAQVEQTLAGDNFGGIALQPSLPWMAQWLKQP